MPLEKLVSFFGLDNKVDSGPKQTIREDLKLEQAIREYL